MIPVLYSMALAVDSFNFKTFEAANLESPTPIITFAYLMQLFFSLLIVFGLIYITAKFVLPKFKIDSSGKFIRVIDRVTIEPQVSTYILKAGRSQYLIGVSNKNITLIDKIESLE